MRHIRRTIILAGAAVGLATLGARTATAQAAAQAAVVPRSSPPAPAPAMTRSTLDGVYTEQQAARGEPVYAEKCAACHDPVLEPVHIINVWEGLPVSELLNISIRETPRDNPGSLTRQEYVDVIAYIFQIYKLPTGKEELPVADSLLRTIRIQVQKP